MTHRDLILGYYDACNHGDRRALLERLDPEVTHYFLAPNPRSGALRGASAIVDGLAELQASFDGRWVVDHYLGDGDEAVIEWTLFWTSAKTGARVATRGAELYRFRDGRIWEIRAYYRQRHDSSELDGFDYAGRGYSTLAEETSAVHRPPPLPR